MIILKPKKLIKKKVAFLFIFLLLATILTTSFGMQSYYKVDFSTGLVTTTNVNVRSGPGTNYSVVTTLKKNEYIRVFAGIGEWYVVQADSNYVGVVNKKYIKPVYSTSSSSSKSNSNTSTQNNSNTSNLTTDELEVFNLINKQRTKNRNCSTKNRCTSSKCS